MIQGIWREWSWLIVLVHLPEILMVLLPTLALAVLVGWGVWRKRRKARRR